VAMEWLTEAVAVVVIGLKVLKVVVDVSWIIGIEGNLITAGNWLWKIPKCDTMIDSESVYVFFEKKMN
jgi:hypothetical protein